ncbi:hypothetical protein ACQBAR_15865 [Propionibacteriaceae bacterium Y1685]
MSLYLKDVVQQSGLLAVADRCLPQVRTVTEALDLRFELSELESDHGGLGQSLEIAGTFIARCWTFWLEDLFPGSGLVGTLRADPELVVNVTQSPMEASQSMPTIARAGDSKADAPFFSPDVERPHHHVQSSFVVATAHVAFPRLVEFEGHILIADQFDPATFSDWKAALNGDRAGLERTVNRFVVWDDLRIDEDAEDQLDDLCAEFIALCWRYWFHDQYPGRRFQVSIVDQYGPTVTVHEIRD